MNRKQITNKLIQEGFTIETLSGFSDKQLILLNKRIDESSLQISKDNPTEIENAKKEKKSFELYEDDVDGYFSDGDEGDTEMCNECADKKQIKEWVSKLVNKKKHSKAPMATKGEIMEMIVKGAINEKEPFNNNPKPAPDKSPSPVITPTRPRTKPGDRPKPNNPFAPKPSVTPNPKANLGDKTKKRIPTWLSFETINKKSK